MTVVFVGRFCDEWPWPKFPGVKRAKVLQTTHSDVDEYLAKMTSDWYGIMMCSDEIFIIITGAVRFMDLCITSEATQSVADVSHKPF